MPLKDAIKEFNHSGCFRLSDEQLSIDGLTLVLQTFHKYPPPLEITLQNIQLIPFTRQKNKHPPPMPLQGAITNQEYESDRASNYPDVFLHQLMGKTSSGSNRPIEKNDFKSEQQSLEGQFLNVLYSSSAWTSLYLDNVIFNWKNINRSLTSDYFNYHLLKYLGDDLRQLNTLTIKLFPINPSQLTLVIQNNPTLTEVACELRTNQSTDSLAITTLLNKIGEHPALKRVNFGRTSLDAAGYQALSTVLDNNYQIESIQLALPQDNDLKVIHEALILRLALTPFERFRKEQLNQKKLLGLVLDAMVAKKNHPVQFILNPFNLLPRITTDEKEAIFETWPAIYQSNRQHLGVNGSLLKLNLDEALEEDSSKSVGYFLLEQAFDQKNAEAVGYLLDAGANLLENSSENSLISQMFDKKHVKTPEVKKMVAHLKSDWSVLIHPASRLMHLAPIHPELNDIKRLLNRYLDILLKRIKFPLKFIQYLTGVLSRLKDRKKEWEHALTHMVYVIEQGNDRPQVSSLILNNMWHLVDLLVKDAYIAKRGLKNRSILNEGLINTCEELKLKLDTWRKELEREETNQSLRLEIDDEKKELKEENERLKKVAQIEREGRVKDKEEMEARAKEQEAKTKEREAKLKKEMEAKAQEREAKLETKLKEQELKLEEQGQGLAQLRKLMALNGFFKPVASSESSTSSAKEPTPHIKPPD